MQDQENSTTSAAAAAEVSSAHQPSSTAAAADADSSAASVGSSSAAAAASSSEEKSHTFRKRRLSLTKTTAAASLQNHRHHHHHSTKLPAGDDGAPAEASSSAGVLADGANEEAAFEEDSSTLASVSSRAQTFRKRRLSLTQQSNSSGGSGSHVDQQHHEQDEAKQQQRPEDAEGDGDDGEHEEQQKSPAAKRQRRDSTASNGSGTSFGSFGSNYFPSRILHSGELLAGGHPQPMIGSVLDPATGAVASADDLDVSTRGGPPPSPAGSDHSVLYRTQLATKTSKTPPGPSPPPPLLVLPGAASGPTADGGDALLGAGGGSAGGRGVNVDPSTPEYAAIIGTEEPAWRTRHTIGNDEHDSSKRLPFPRHVVGTYSCHGIEPIYDDDEDDEEDDVVDEGWDSPNAAETTSPQQPIQHTDKAEGLTVAEQDASAPAATPPPSSLEPQQQQPVVVAKTNQDRGGVAFPYGNCPRTALFAVYDGHGMGGESVSQFALHEVQRRLEKHAAFQTDLAKAFKDTFLQVDEALKNEPLIEPLYAGTTACVALLKDSRLHVANVGDSRAVVARRRSRRLRGTNGASPHPGGVDSCDAAAATASEEKPEFDAIPLTEDQNPDLPSERARITKMGGHVTDPPAPGLSARVWLDERCTQIGLAMSRSIGDHAVAPVGVIAEPVVTEYEVDVDDEFLILASDGVWEFLDSADAVNVVAKHLDRGATKACQALIEAAADKWHEEEGEYRDDVTAIVVKLQELWKDNITTRSRSRSSGRKRSKIDSTSSDSDKKSVSNGEEVAK